MKWASQPSKNSIVPFIIAIVTMFGFVFWMENGILHSTRGIFSYPLDDPYIHMQIARNLALHNSWGINPYEFSSASSSLLYTVLLAAVFKIFSVNVITPFIINVVASFLLLYVIHSWLMRQELTGAARTVIMLLVVLFTPLPSLIISGMEHTLQCLLFFLFITNFADYAAAFNQRAHPKEEKIPWKLLLYGAGVVAIRYEGLFLIGLACLVLLFQKRIKISLILGIISSLPIIIFGIWSLFQGSYFLPNSVLVKSESFSLSIVGITEFFSNIFINKLTFPKATQNIVGTPPAGISLLATQRLLIILPLCALFFHKIFQKRSAFYFLLILLTGTTLLHLSLAATGWFYRYEAYLILSTMVLVPTILVKFGLQALSGRDTITRIFTGLLIFTLCFPLLLRSGAAFLKTKQACINIFSQQYQMAQFLKKYYQGATVAANDIGALSFFTNAKIIDLWGLGNIDVARSKKGSYWNPVFLDSLVNAHHVKLAIVYDEWFDPSLLRSWKKLATWQISNNVICGSDFVSFYSINEADAIAIKNNLQEFQKYLPNVKVEYFQ